jgi:hypothetical protein
MISRPQGLKPLFSSVRYGTTEAAPCYEPSSRCDEELLVCAIGSHSQDWLCYLKFVQAV